MIVAEAAFDSVVIGLPPPSTFERRLQVFTFALAEADWDAQPLKMLIDDLAAEAHAMLGEKLFDLVLAIEQRDDRLAHPRQRVVGIFVDHLVPMRARKVPRF